MTIFQSSWFWIAFIICWPAGSLMLSLFLGRMASRLRGPSLPPLPSGSIDWDGLAQRRASKRAHS